MKYYLLFIVAWLLFLLTSISTVLAANPVMPCQPGVSSCAPDYECLPLKSDPNDYYCQYAPFSKIFGKITPPDALKGLVAKDPTGAGGISQFLSNLITLIYSLAVVVLIFMLIWGAFDWITSEGDKEKLSKAQQKIISAIIGIILFAIAFAVIRVLGQFTGFTFFVGQK